PDSSGATTTVPPAPNYGSSPTGTFTESSGFVILDSAHAGTISGASTGDPFAANLVTLATNTAPPDNPPGSANDGKGTKITNSFTVNAVFNLTFPDDLRETYGIRLSDNQIINSTPVPGHDTLELSVRTGQNGLVQVQFRNFDPAADTSPTNISSFFLDPS